MVAYGLAVNPEHCLVWADDFESPLIAKLRANGLIRHHLNGHGPL